jgi:hypothetical protein
VRTTSLANSLGGVELIVAQDNFLTPTARHADIVLPATTFWERNDQLSAFCAAFPARVRISRERLSFEGSHPMKRARLIRDQPPITTRVYKGTQARATKLFERDAADLATLGYFPTNQNWAPGQWSAGHFIVAIILCFVLIGFIVFIFMLVVKPAGTLRVTYERRKVPVQEVEKTCPQCAERVKAAALVCRFCGHKFA